MFSVAMLEVRPELSGVLFAITPGKLTLASTDTHRLSERELPIDQQATERSVVIPQRGLAEVVRIINNEEEGEATHIQLQLAQNQAVFLYGSSEVITRTVDMAYPDYKQIIPKQFQTEFTMGREELSKAIKAANLFSQDDAFDVQIVVNAGEKTVQVSAANAKRGKNSVTCVADTVVGTDFSLKMNGRYVIDGLSAMNSEGVTCKISDTNTPCVFVPNGTADQGGCLYIVMPLSS
jgi:DNA polymerase-3 subunit beta